MLRSTEGEDEVESAVCSLWACAENKLVDEFSKTWDPLVAFECSQLIPLSLNAFLPTGEAVLFMYLFLGR